MAWAAIVVGGASITAGIIKDSKANKANKLAQSKVEAYQTPQEVYDVLKATQNNAQSGFDASTLDYLTNQTDQAFSASLASAERMGGDPNVLSNIFGQKVNAIKGVAAQDHAISMQNFSAYLNAKNSVAANVAAEQKSQQDILKNELQKIAQDKADATQQIGQGINAGISAFANNEMSNLFTPGRGNLPTLPQSTNSTGYNPNTNSSGALRQTGLVIPK